MKAEYEIKIKQDAFCFQPARYQFPLDVRLNKSSNRRRLQELKQNYWANKSVAWHGSSPEKKL